MGDGTGKSVQFLIGGAKPELRVAVGGPKETEAPADRQDVVQEQHKVVQGDDLLDELGSRAIERAREYQGQVEQGPEPEQAAQNAASRLQALALFG